MNHQNDLIRVSAKIAIKLQGFINKFDEEKYSRLAQPAIDFTGDFPLDRVQFISMTLSL